MKKKTVFAIVLATLLAFCLVFAACPNGTAGNGNGNNNGNGGSVVTVSTAAQLLQEIRSGNKTIKLAAGNYTITTKTGSGLPLENYPLSIASRNVTLLPPDSGTATINAGAGTNQDIFQVHEGTLTLGKEGATGNLIIDGSGKTEILGSLLSIGTTGGKIIMYDGVSLVNNTRSAVSIRGAGTFEMKGGVISGNRTSMDGAGVEVYRGGSFVMEGGTISGNTASSYGNGGGVAIGVFDGDRGTFTMKGGVIKKNTAGRYGGGVYVGAYGDFIMEGGTIYGYSSNDLLDVSNSAGSSHTSGAALYQIAGSTAKFRTTDGEYVSFPAQSVNTTINGRKE